MGQDLPEKQFVEELIEETRYHPEERVQTDRTVVLGLSIGKVVHELRSLLSIMSTSVSSLEQVSGHVSGDAAKYLGLIRSEIRHAEALISNLLGSTQIKAAGRED